MLWIGALALLIPTLAALARDVWATDQGAHGPIIMGTAIWLFFRARETIVAVARPGDGPIAAVIMTGALVIYLAASITGMLGIQCLAVYAAFVAAFYYHFGADAVKRMWFPLLYILFMFPQPETLVLPLSREMKLLLSTAAVHLLSLLGMQIGQGGVVIYFDQYELLVADACSGLRSLIGLTAIGIFYCYMHYEGHWRQSLPLLLMVPVIAILSNFVRVLTLISVTSWWGERFMQRYVHDFAGLLLYSVALAMMIGADRLLGFYRARRRTQ